MEEVREMMKVVMVKVDENYESTNEIRKQMKKIRAHMKRKVEAWESEKKGLLERIEIWRLDLYWRRSKGGIM